MSVLPRFLDQQTLDDDFDRLVQESPIPQLLHSRGGNQVVFSQQPLSSRPTSASAIPRVRPTYHNDVDLAPFRSPQTLSRSFAGANSVVNQSIADVFKHLKNHNSAESKEFSDDLNDSSFKENEDINNTRPQQNTSTGYRKVQTIQTTGQPFRQVKSSMSQNYNGNLKTGLQNIPDNVDFHQNSNIRLARDNNQNNNQKTDNYQAEFRNYVQSKNPSSKELTRKQVQHGNYNNSPPQNKGSADVVMLGKGCAGRGRRNLATVEEDRPDAETFQEAFQEAFGDSAMQQNEEEEMDPCSLYMWIIKQVQGTNEICVEGKKSNEDDNFWHSGVITRRVSEKIVATQSGSVYRLEGNMELLDAMSAGIPRSVAEAFWLGFPPDWKGVIQNHFHKLAHTVNHRSDGKQSDSEDDISLCGNEYANDVGGASIDEVDTEDDSVSMVDDIVSSPEDDEIAITEVDPEQEEVCPGDLEAELHVKGAGHKKRGRPSKKSVESREMLQSQYVEDKTKDHVLSKWIVRPLPTCNGVYVLGTKTNGLLWHSSAIERRLDKRRLLSSSGAVYKLKGNIDKLLAINEGVPEEIIDKFVSGFPKEWQEMVQQYYNIDRNTPLKKKSKMKYKSKSPGTSKERLKSDNESRQSKAVKQQNTKSKIQAHVLSSNSTDTNGSKNRLDKSKEKKHQTMTVRTPINKANRRANSLKLETSIDEKPKKQVFTPRGEVVDVEMLGRSRSGRLIKPPLQWWTGQRVHMDGDTIMISAPTATANKYLQDFEDGYKMSTKKPKKYFNPKEKDKDYSIMSWKKSFNDTKSSISSIEFEENKPIVQGTKKSSTITEVSEDSENDLDIDKSKDDFPKIELEVNEILEKSKEKRSRKRPQRQTCYSQVGVNSRRTSKVAEISDHYDSQSEDNDSTLIDTEASLDESQNKDSDLQRKLKSGAIKGKSVVSKDKNRSKSKSKKSNKGVKSKLEQENIVSSSTGERDIQLRTRSKTLKITSKPSDSSRTNTAKATENEVKALLRPKISRKVANKKLPVICEDDVDDSENEFGVGNNKFDKVLEKVEQGSGNRRLSRGNKRLPNKDKGLAAATDVAEVDGEQWTADEKHRLFQACKTTGVSDVHYWQKVATAVGTKSVGECQDMYYTENHRATSSARKTKHKETKVKPKVTTITANVGTLKRKQQLKDLVEQYNENHEDDLFDSTPFRQTRKRKMPKLSCDDDAIFEETAHKQGKSRFETPVAMGDRGLRSTMRFASEKKTPASYLNPEIEEFSREVDDGYVHRMMKRRLHGRTRKHVETPKPTKKVTSKLDDSPQKKLFHEYIEEAKDTTENHVDSDQEQDYYWEDDDTL